jgi:hypothetical protein
MSGFETSRDFSPALVLLAGAAAALAAWGWGDCLLTRGRGLLSRSWEATVAFLLGLLIQSFFVQLAAILAVATQTMLIVLWFFFVIPGVSWAAIRLSRTRFPELRGRSDIELAAPLLIVAVGLGINLLIAWNPSTKADEVYYHMLLPARLLMDGQLLSYAYPFPAAVMPQMVFQIGFAPLHALGAPDAGNLVSWAAQVLLVLLAASVTYKLARSKRWALVGAALIPIGLYPAVWQVTSGAHAFGDLAIIAAVLGFCLLLSLPPQSQPTRLAACFGVLTVSAAATKVSLIPMALFLLAVTIGLLLRQGAPARIIFVAALLPWGIFFLPLTIWTWMESGSPFGMLSASVTASHLYFPGEAETALRIARELNQIPPGPLLRETLASIPAVVWVLIALFFRFNRQRLLVASAVILLVGQVLAVALLLPYHVRFLGGLHYALAILGLASIASHPMARTRWLAPLAALTLLPWLAVQIYYARPFIAAHSDSTRKAFYEKYVPLMTDFEKLDRILPPDATILIEGWGAASYYGPRRIIYDRRDLRAAKNVFLLVVEPSDQPHVAPAGTSAENLIYRNDTAKITTYRSPAASPEIGRVTVYALGADVSRRDARRFALDNQP